MKSNLIDEIRNILEQSKSWIQLEVEYAKLSIAEKLTVLMSSLILGFVCLLFGMVVLIILAMSLAEVFKWIMNPAFAYLATAGSIIVLIALLFVFKKPLLLNPIARLMTRVFFDKKHSHTINK